MTLLYVLLGLMLAWIVLDSVMYFRNKKKEKDAIKQVVELRQNLERFNQLLDTAKKGGGQ